VVIAQENSCFHLATLSVVSHKCTKKHSVTKTLLFSRERDDKMISDACHCICSF